MKVTYRYPLYCCQRFSSRSNLRVIVAGRARAQAQAEPAQSLGRLSIKPEWLYSFNPLSGQFRNNGARTTVEAFDEKRYNNDTTQGRQVKIQVHIFNQQDCVPVSQKNFMCGVTLGGVGRCSERDRVDSYAS